MSEALPISPHGPALGDVGEILSAAPAAPAPLGFELQRVFDLRSGNAFASLLLPRGGDGSPASRLMAEAERAGAAHRFDMVCLGRALVVARAVSRPRVLQIPVTPPTVRLLDVAALSESLGRTSADGMHLQLDARYAPLLAGLASRIDALRPSGVGLCVARVDPRFTKMGPILDVRPTMLKAHPALTNGAEDDADARAALLELVAWSRRIGAVLAAAGLERKSERRALLAMGVTHGEGPYFGAPLQVSSPREAGAA